MAKKRKKRNSGGEGGELPTTNGTHPSTSHPNVQPSNVHPKFLEAQAKFTDVIKQNLEKNKQEYQSSSEEDDIESNVLDDIMDKLLSAYKKSGGQFDGLGKTHKYLDDAFNSGAAICLICIASIKRSDSIWSCKGCFCFFHLDCIQRWGRDNIAQKRIHHDELLIDVEPPPLTFACPKCRTEYSQDEVPQQYVCFCGAKKDPPLEPWLVPHSCGEHCGKSLQPDCGHVCLLLCHPGPCPPCPKMVKTSCECGQNSRPQRCNNKNWTCKSTCNKTLLCGVHKCKLQCHTGVCEPCPQQSLQDCLCGSEQKVRPCSQPEWQCGKVCGNMVSCGFHQCEHVCHKPPCSPCARSQARHCPCGKKKFTLPCTEDVPSCGDTCDKMLNCGAHKCIMRCHKNKCGQCLEILVKSCRCGVRKKEVPCAKEFICETKCKKMRNCYLHACNKKCCKGDCPPCEKPCGKTLSCGNHKCAALCHVGPCYPCILTEKVSCRCGAKSITVSCGAKRKTKPPKCKNRCRLKPDCHHTQSSPHSCHFGECPPCSQVCGKSLECGTHTCPMICHSSVLTDVAVHHKPVGPWDIIKPKYVKKSFPCDLCKEPVESECFGKHEKRTLPCYKSTPSFPCKSPCNFPLVCANHKCRLPCHVKLIRPENPTVSLTCEGCDSKCPRPRPAGCHHPCLQPCHSGPCPPCEMKVKLKCHCALNHVYVPCFKWTAASPEEKTALLRCLVRCPKTYDCGHLCVSECHTGPCPVPERCEKKVKVKCPCKRITKEVACADVKLGAAKVECNAQCEKKIDQVRKMIEEEEERKKRDEELKMEQELKTYQRKFQPNRTKKTKEAKHYEVKRKSFWEKHSSQILVASGFVVLVLTLVYIVVTNLDEADNQ